MSSIVAIVRTAELGISVLGSSEYETLVQGSRTMMGLELFFCWIRYVLSGVERIAYAVSAGEEGVADFKYSL